MDEKRRNFFATVVQQSKQLSECTKPKAALIVRGEGISVSGIGINRILISGGTGKVKADIETSPVFEALTGSGIFGKYSEETRPGNGYNSTSNREFRAAFLTYFPHVDELKLLYQSGVQVIYFFGEIDDEDSVTLLNTLIY